MVLLQRGLAYQARLATPCLLYYSLATMLLLHIGHAALGVSFLTAPLVTPYSLYYSLATMLLLHIRHAPLGVAFGGHFGRYS